MGILPWLYPNHTSGPRLDPVKCRHSRRNYHRRHLRDHSDPFLTHTSALPPVSTWSPERQGPQDLPGEVFFPIFQNGSARKSPFQDLVLPFRVDQKVQSTSVLVPQDNPSNAGCVCVWGVSPQGLVPSTALRSPGCSDIRTAGSNTCPLPAELSPGDPIHCLCFLLYHSRLHFIQNEPTGRLIEFPARST